MEGLIMTTSTVHMDTLNAVLNAYVTETSGDAWLEGGGGAGPWIYAPTMNGWTVVIDVTLERWEASRQHDDYDPVALPDGPAIDAPVTDVVAWMRRCCDAEPDRDSRQYVIGLPVVITVASDGTVTAEVDLSEADDIYDVSVPEGQDTSASALDHDASRIAHAASTGQVTVR
jgi:hypothetical protein